MIRITSLKGACATLTACFADLRILLHPRSPSTSARAITARGSGWPDAFGGASCRFDSSSACFEIGQVAWPISKHAEEESKRQDAPPKASGQPDPRAVIARAEVDGDLGCKSILRSAKHAVKVAHAPFKEVILIISSGQYKSLKVFIEFEKIKNYDAVEITRY